MIPQRLRRFYALAISIGIGAVLLSLSLIVPVTGTSTDFSIYNTGWNGTSRLAVKTYEAGKFVPSLELRGTGTEASPAIISLDKIQLDPGNSTILIIGPDEEFSGADGDYVADFLARGGIVMLADDFGTGNSLLRFLPTTSRFTGQLVVDLAFEKKPEFVVVYDLDDYHELTHNVSMALLNYPSGISPGPYAQVIASTSAASWVDSDGDQFRDANEASGPFPVMSVERIGLGTLVLLSDPSLLINSMYEQLDNSVLVDNLLRFASEGRAFVLIDESHRNYFDPITFSAKIAGSLDDRAKLILVLVIVSSFFIVTTDALSKGARLVTRTVLGIWRWLMSLMFKEKADEEHTLMTDEELLGQVLERHPDWSKGVLIRLLKQVKRHGSVEE